MKVKRILSAVLAVIFMLGVLSSCVTDAAEISVNLTIKAGDDKIFNKAVSVADPEGDGVSVIDVVNEAIAQYELKITLDSAGNSITGVNKYVETTIDDSPYFWMYTINGVEPTTGKASTNIVVDGDSIEYIFAYSVKISDEKSTTYQYKSEQGLFGKNDDETEVATETDAE